MDMGGRGTVLILDDDGDVVRAAKTALAPHVARVEGGSSPEGMERILSGEAFDAVLLDMNFAPGMRSGAEGLDALARIRVFDPTLAVVLMTAFGGVSLAVDSLKRGAVDFVLKPWRNEKLVGAVCAAIKDTAMRRRSEDLDLAALEKNAIERALARHDGNVSSAASALGLSRAALYRRMAKYGL
jgi:DNA-binding NtrC family response regulator